MAEFDFADEMDESRTNVYLAGPLLDIDDPEYVHEHIKDVTSEQGLRDKLNWVDPMNLEPEFANGWEMIRKDLEAVENVDAVLAYRPAGAESWGTQREIAHAQKVNTPVVIWNMDGGDFNHWMTRPFVVEDELSVALDAVLALAKLRL